MAGKLISSILKLGTLRQVVLYRGEAPESVQKEYDYLFKSPLVKNKFIESKPVIIGMINESYPLLKNSKGNDESIYINFNFLEPGKLITVADDKKKLQQIIELLKKLWAGKENEIALLKTSENLQLYNEVMHQIKKDNPASDERFWDYLAFRELSIHLY